MLILSLTFLLPIIILLFGQYIKVYPIIIINYLLQLFFLLYLNYEIFILNNVLVYDIYNLIPITNLMLSFNKISLTLLNPVIFISFFVNIYIKWYMKGEPHIIRFYGLINLFSAFMILLVASNSPLLLLFGWEGIGISSFLLISFYYSSTNSIKSGLSAFYINKFGDIFLVISVILLINHMETHYLLSISLIIAAITKSAQYPFYKWLPESMAAPTPVSALLHAATLVTAGVYLLILYKSEFSTLILIIGSFTTSISGIFAICQFDIKKIIAFSTCSQIALCFVAIGLTNYNLALYHLFNHSFYKALLFLCAGIIIHNVNSWQDIRKYGSIYFKLPITYSCFIIGSLSLMAIPGMSGYYSKDLIIENSITTLFSPFIYLSGILTTIYSINLLRLSFISIPKNTKSLYQEEFLENNLTLFTIIPLSLLSIFIGFITNPDELIKSDFEYIITNFEKSLIFILTIITTTVVIFAWKYKYTVKNPTNLLIWKILLLSKNLYKYIESRLCLD